MKPKLTDKQIRDYCASGGVITTPLYWDCECAQDYIRRKDIEPYCERCGRVHEEQPDSRLDEVIKYGLPAYHQEGD